MIDPSGSASIGGSNGNVTQLTCSPLLALLCKSLRQAQDERQQDICQYICGSFFARTAKNEPQKKKSAAYFAAWQPYAMAGIVNDSRAAKLL
jgi:hypothetical protein